MDFDEFEAQNGEAAVSKSSSCCRPSQRTVEEMNLDALLDGYGNWEDWSDYMNYGMGGRKGRDYFGFHLPHRTNNEDELI